MNSIFSTIKKNKLDVILYICAFLVGAAVLVIPVPYLVILISSIFIFIFFVKKPIYSYYALILTIPFIDRIRALPISFSINDIFILLTTVVVLVNMAISKDKVSLKTKIDLWILLLLIIHFAAGLYSFYDRGLLSSFKFSEVILTYYITVYFIRTKKVKIATILKLLLFTGLIQALIGILQSTTGGFGAVFQSNRGYLGYFGLGSTRVWHAWGSFGGNGFLPNFLTILLFFFLPLKNYFKSNMSKIILFIYIVAIYMGYSKESLLTFFICSLFYLIFTAKDFKKIVFKLSGVFLALACVGSMLMSTPFAETVFHSLRDRLYIWQYPLLVFSNNPHYLIFGTGLNSYFEIIKPVLPITELMKSNHGGIFVHNYYFLVLQEMGIVGFLILFSFLFYILWFTTKKYIAIKGISRHLYLSVFLVITTIFTTGFFGMLFSFTPIQVLFFILFAIIFSKLGKKEAEGFNLLK